MISGESIPVEKITGSKVIGGTINKSGSFEFEITAPGDNSVLGRIIKMVEEAQGSKAPIQKIADKVAAVFVPVVVVIAAVTLIAWIIASGDPAKALVNFVSVLIIACPCALGLATPAAIMTGTGKGAGLGILIKNGESLESAHKISTVIFDKTGTITEGKPQITDIIASGISEEELLKLAASIEVNSEHPLGQTIVQYARNKNIHLYQTSSFKSRQGYGIYAEVNGLNAAAGNKRFMKELSVSTDSLNDKAEKLYGEGKTIIYIAINNELNGLIALGDPLKADSAEAINELKKMRIKTVMLTGDNKKAAASVAAQLRQW
jgi:Cu+-exporting ATPase